MPQLTLGDTDIIVFTDGSSRGNPGRGGYGAVTLYSDAHGVPHVDELGGREDLTTNNRMELKAVIEAIKNFIDYYEDLTKYSFIFYVDSSYVVKGVSSWLAGWIRNGWKTGGGKEDVKNRDLWEELAALLKDADGHGRLNVKWNLIEGHAGVVGNERCDVIATSYADNKPDTLYTGSLSGYQTNPAVADILNIRAVNQHIKDAAKLRKKSKSSGAPAYSYISMVDGKIETHSVWKECEARVKGKSGARFKKSFSAHDEKSVIEDFLKKA